MNNPQIFSASAWDWSDETEFTWFHPDKTEEQFRKDVGQCMAECTKEVIAEGQRFISTSDWLKTASKKMKELGYEQPIYCRCALNETIIDGTEADLTAAVGVLNIVAVADHNKKIHQELDKRNGHE